MSTTFVGPTGPVTPTGGITGGTTGGVTGVIGTSPEIRDFFATLDGPDLSIEAPISEPEAIEAIILFSVANVLLAGMGQRKVGNEEKTDVLGILTLYYGLQDGSLTNKIVLNSQSLWKASLNGGGQGPVVEDELKALRDNLDQLGQDVVFLSREAKRQFNLGVNNDVVGNVEFPRLFKRYVDIAGDARLTLNLREEDKPNSFTSKEKIGEAYDLLSELKGVILQIVRSLSKYGTIATSRANKDWAKFENRAFKVLRKVGEKRFTEDVDETRILTVLADLTGKNQETVISPYFALARNGGQLLTLAFETYRASQAELDNFERDRLLNLFQAPGDASNFLTTRMRNQALIVKRYQLANWG